MVIGVPGSAQDLQMCRKHTGNGTGKLCSLCEGRCVICDSYVHPHTIVHVCDECHLGPSADRCIICSKIGVSDAFYCRQCVLSDRDKDGCPRVTQILYKTSSLRR
ncbi:hypothetical protein GEMRC1_013042 [Eukaryota sp. GEM-RC1]